MSTTLTQPIKWHRIPGFSAYLVNDAGAVWSCLKSCGTGQGGPISQVNTGHPRRRLKPDLRKEDGRKRHTLLSDDGRYVRKYVSHFVLLATCGPRPEGYEACHENGDCTDDRPSNLRWGTSSSNKSDMVRHGTAPIGERSTTAKLGESEVIQILDRLRNGESGKDLASEFGVTSANISAIKARKTWKHLKWER